MLQIIKSIFSPPKPERPVGPILRFQRSGDYQLGLVNSLQDDHARLIELYTEINAALGKKRYRAVSEKLNTFQSALSSHLLQESFSLYNALRVAYRDKPEKCDEMAEAENSMKSIGAAVKNFCIRWIERPVTSATAEKFHKELTEIGAELLKRVQYEESTLYPQYEALKKK